MVWCTLNSQRSVAVILAYIIKTLKISLEDAMEYLEQCGIYDKVYS